MIYIFFGPPGAGKGTQADLLSNKLNIPHLSTGEILRKKLLDNDALSKELKRIIDNGDLVSDEILNQIFLSKILEDDCRNGYILDGYPRTTIQQDFLSDFLKKNNLKIKAIFDLFVDEKLVVQRIISRSKIENREDDKETVIKNRITKYINETKPLSEYYKNNYPESYHLINGNKEVELIHEDILKIAKK